VAGKRKLACQGSSPGEAHAPLRTPSLIAASAICNEALPAGSSAEIRSSKITSRYGLFVGFIDLFLSTIISIQAS
jgi:hypothetical protein